MVGENGEVVSCLLTSTPRPQAQHVHHYCLPLEFCSGFIRLLYCRTNRRGWRRRKRRKKTTKEQNGPGVKCTFVPVCSQYIVVVDTYCGVLATVIFVVARRLCVSYMLLIAHLCEVHINFVPVCSQFVDTLLQFLVVSYY